MVQGMTVITGKWHLWLLLCCLFPYIIFLYTYLLSKPPQGKQTFCHYIFWRYSSISDKLKRFGDILVGFLRRSSWWLSGIWCFRGLVNFGWWQSFSPISLLQSQDTYILDFEGDHMREIVLYHISDKLGASWYSFVVEEHVDIWPLSTYQYLPDDYVTILIVHLWLSWQHWSSGFSHAEIICHNIAVTCNLP